MRVISSGPRGDELFSLVIRAAIPARSRDTVHRESNKLLHVEEITDRGVRKKIREAVVQNRGAEKVPYWFPPHVSQTNAAVMFQLYSAPKRLRLLFNKEGKIQ